MRQLMTSALLSLAVSAVAALPAAASDTARASGARERPNAPRTYHQRHATVHRAQQHFAYHSQWQTYDEDALRPRPRHSRVAVRGRRSAEHVGHWHVRGAMHDRRGHRTAGRAAVGRRTAWHGAPSGHHAANPSPSRDSASAHAPRVGGQQGLASFYWEPQRLASGGWFNPNALTAAHRSLPFGTRVRVTHRSSGRSVDVTINDRGPYVAGRIIDLSRAAAGAIGMTGQGIAQVTLQVLGR